MLVSIDAVQNAKMKGLSRWHNLFALLSWSVKVCSNQSIQCNLIQVFSISDSVLYWVNATIGRLVFVLYFIILCCIVLCCILLYCVVLYCIVLYCIALYKVLRFFNLIQSAHLSRLITR